MGKRNPICHIRFGRAILGLRAAEMLNSVQEMQSLFWKDHCTYLRKSTGLGRNGWSKGNVDAHVEFALYSSDSAN